MLKTVIATVVTILANDYATQDDARVVHHQIMTSKQCQEWQAGKRLSKQPVVDRATNRRVLKVYYECMPISIGIEADEAVVSSLSVEGNSGTTIAP